jgi:hypothetical protein
MPSVRSLSSLVWYHHHHHAAAENADHIISFLPSRSIVFGQRPSPQPHTNRQLQVITSDYEPTSPQDFSPLSCIVAARSQDTVRKSHAAMSVIDSPASWDALTIAEKIMECSAFDELPGFNFFQLPRVAMILQTRPETFSAIQSNFECCNFDDIWKSSALHAVKADAIAHQIKASVPLQAKPDFKIIHLMHLIGSLNRSNQLDAISSHIDNGDWDTVWVCPSVYEARQVAIGKKIMASDALRKKPGFHLLKRHIRKLGLPRMELMLKDIMADNWDSVWECKEFSSFKEEVIIELILESNTLKQKPGFKFLDPKYLDLWQDDPDVLDELLSNLNDDDMDRVWASEAIREAITKAKDQAKDNTTVRVGSISDLQKAWNDEFIPQTLSTFIEAITANHRTFDITKHYSKFTPIVQSSGVGKSRLVDEFSKKVLGILFTFRMNDDTGYPPGDPEIRKYIMDHMQRPNDESVARPMAVAASLIAASISSMHSLVRAGLHTLGQGQYGNLLDYLHKEMAPVALRVATEDRALSPTNQKIQGTRSLKVGHSLLLVGKCRVRDRCRSQPKIGHSLLLVGKYRVRGHQYDVNFAPTFPN